MDLGMRGWLIVIGGVTAAFLVLTVYPVQSFPASFVPALLFVGIQLAGLRLAAGKHWTAPFRRVGLRDVGLMLAFGVATVLISFAMALVVLRLAQVAPNPITVALTSMGWGEMLLTLLPTIPQLVGEELLSILPFLFIMWLLHRTGRFSRRMSMGVALVGSSLLFGAAHLPTYDWNWAQALGIIGTARFILTLAFIWTRNVWVSAGAHIINDWSEFLLGHALSALPRE